jgi:hypothetical protein
VITIFGTYKTENHSQKGIRSTIACHRTFSVFAKNDGNGQTINGSDSLPVDHQMNLFLEKGPEKISPIIQFAPE